ncbi:MAG: DUF4870 domain-containing protein, partial [Ardenticatenaceae bacterium]
PLSRSEGGMMERYEWQNRGDTGRERLARVASEARGMERSTPTEAECALGMAAHFCGFLNLLLPLLGAPLVMIALGRLAGESRFVEGHIQEALAFQVVHSVVGLALLSVLAGNFLCLPLAPIAIVWGLWCNASAARTAWRGAACRGAGRASPSGGAGCASRSTGMGWRYGPACREAALPTAITGAGRSCWRGGGRG